MAKVHDHAMRGERETKRGVRSEEMEKSEKGSQGEKHSEEA